MLLKSLLVQENNNQMSLLKPLTLTGFLIALAISASASAGLYGFNSANPYTYEEEILDIKIAPKFIVNYRKAMRKNIISLANFANAENKSFQIIVHDGEELMHKSLWEYHLDGYNEARKNGIDASDPSFLAKLKSHAPEREPIAGTQSSVYTKKLSGIVVNNRFCGNRKISRHITDAKLKVISIDNCKTENAYDEALMNAVGLDNLLYAFIKPENAFKKIKKQPIINENARNIFDIQEAANITFLIDDSLYDDRETFLEDIRNSNYDVVIINPFFQHKKAFSKEDIESLKFKKNGAKRLIFAKMNISEASSNDYYWQKSWQIGKPNWLSRASFVDQNAIITQYWEDDWKKVMGHYFKGIVDSGFDGAFLTGLENHDYFEKQTPLE